MSYQKDEDAGCKATKNEDVLDDQRSHDQTVQDHQVSSDHVQEGKSDGNDSNNPQSPQLLEEVAIKKKYGGLLPKKPPLISKDHEHAFFDSADWALGKQAGGQKHKGPLEALRPKLQPTPHHQTRSRRALSDNNTTQDEANTTDDDHQNIHDDSTDIDNIGIDQANVREERRNWYHELADHDTGAPAAAT